MTNDSRDNRDSIMRRASDRSWSVGIVGTFDVENYGDLLFPLLAEEELRRRLGDVTVRPFSYRPRTWPYAVTSVEELPRQAASLDALLIGGGFLIRFDKDVAPAYGPPSAEIHHPTGYWLTPALIAHQYGVPVIWNAPGMHCNEIPEWASTLVRLAFEQSRYVAVRDEPSRAALAPLLNGKSIAVVPDTGFGIVRIIPRTMSRELEQFRAETGIHRPYILVQASESMAPYAERFASIPGTQAVAMPIGPVLGETPSNLGQRLLHPKSWPHPLVLAELIANATAVAGHSYHLAITALMTGVPLFSPIDSSVGKFTALHSFRRLRPMPAAGEPLPMSFPREVPPEVDVDWHWDRVAAAIGEGRSAPQVALSRFWQSLPDTLEALSSAARND